MSALPAVVRDRGSQENFDRLNSRLGVLEGLVLSGSGSPEKAISASVGALYLRTDGGAGSTLYVKESGSKTKEGWIAK
jgi:hypothetical protein